MILKNINTKIFYLDEEYKYGYEIEIDNFKSIRLGFKNAKIAKFYMEKHIMRLFDYYLDFGSMKAISYYASL